jgi:WD40 repeat protein
MDKMVKVWDGRDAKLLKVLDRQKFPGTGHSHSVNALCRLPALEQRGKRRLLASAGDDKIIRLWEINPE